MMGNSGRSGAYAEPIGTTPAAAVETPASTGDDVIAVGQENMSAAKSPGSIVWWVTLLLVYIGWDFFQNNERIRNSLEPANIRANIHNLIVIGLGAVIFINGGNVLFTKLAAMRIPVLSRVAGTMLPLFHL
jgi:hypothetical protein